MAVCKNCLLPDAVPGAAFDARGICRFCQEYSTIDHGAAERLHAARCADLEQALQACRGQGEYDCLVPLSGGKDSVYLIYKLKEEYGLRVCAQTTDSNIGAVAWSNIRRALDKLDVEHIVYRPSQEFYRKLFWFLLQNQEERGAVHTVSDIYAPLFEGNALQLAVEKRIPLILAGYSPGRPNPERIWSMNCRGWPSRRSIGRLPHCGTVACLMRQTWHAFGTPSAMLPARHFRATWRHTPPGPTTRRRP